METTPSNTQNIPRTRSFPRQLYSPGFTSTVKTRMASLTGPKQQIIVKVSMKSPRADLDRNAHHSCHKQHSTHLWLPSVWEIPGGGFTPCGHFGLFLCPVEQIPPATLYYCWRLAQMYNKWKNIAHISTSVLYSACLMTCN